MIRTVGAVAVIVCMMLVLSCKKQAVYAPVDFNRINAILEDNYNLSLFQAALQRTGMDDVLQQQAGPFTVFVPSDYAFSNLGISDRTGLFTRPYAWIQKIVNYHVIPGNYQLSKLPFQFNQELRSNAGKLFVTHWMKGNDTVYTVNGALVSLQDVTASNGRIQIIDKVLEPYVFDKISDAIRGDTITLFSEALRRSGLMDTLNGSGVFTVFAPSNDAMRRYGYDSIEQIRDAPPEELRTLCNYHISRDLHFVYDYILTTSGDESSERMLDDFSLSIKPVADAGSPGGYSGIHLAGPGNTTDVNIIRGDVLAGNGVFHIVDNVLRMTR